MTWKCFVETVYVCASSCLIAFLLLLLFLLCCGCCCLSGVSAANCEMEVLC